MSLTSYQAAPPRDPKYFGTLRALPLRRKLKPVYFCRFSPCSTPGGNCRRSLLRHGCAARAHRRGGRASAWPSGTRHARAWRGERAARHAGNGKSVSHWALLSGCAWRSRNYIFLESQRGRRAGVEDIHLAVRFVNSYHFQHALLFAFSQVKISPCFVLFRGGRREQGARLFANLEKARKLDHRQIGLRWFWRRRRRNGIQMENVALGNDRVRIGGIYRQGRSRPGPGEKNASKNDSCSLDVHTAANFNLFREETPPEKRSCSVYPKH